MMRCGWCAKSIASVNKPHTRKDCEMTIEKEIKKLKENIARLTRANDLLEKQIKVSKKSDENLKRRKSDNEK